MDPASPDDVDPDSRPHRPDLFKRSMTSTPNQLYPYHQQAFVRSTSSSHARQYRSMSNLTDPPPLPPKPIDYMDINTSEDFHPPPLPPPPSFSSPPSPPTLIFPPSLTSPPLTSPPLPPPLQDELVNTASTEDSDELAMVLALSQSESVQKRLLEEQLINQEEEDLARALAASMLPSESYFPTNANLEANVVLGTSFLHASPSRIPQSLPITPSSLNEESSDQHDTYGDFGRYDKWRIPNLPQEAAPKTLEVQASPSFSNVSLPSHTSAIDADKSSSQEILTNQDADESSDLFSTETVLQFDDEAYARQLASEEEKILQQLNQSRFNEEDQKDGFVDQGKPSSTSYGKQNAEGRRPQHVPLEEPYDRQYPQDTSPSTPMPTFPPIGRASPYQPGIHQSNRKLSLPFSPITYPSLGSRRGSASDVHPETSQTSSLPNPHDDKPQVRPQGPAKSEGRQHSQTLPSQPIATTSTTTLNQTLPPSAGLLNVNHFVDHDLLRGVSIGFKGPMISTRLVPMQDEMPNIISLPFTRCPPLHIQAPDWRHLLRLMARLSGTRIEPTVEATTVSRAEVKLRTVIQFVKPHPSSNEWRVVLWFTIDQPVPPSVPNASRYNVGNPNLLPWSYTISPIPVLLRDACDTSMSKTYTIPATDTVPLPTLPITFPDLALYLQAALDTSRRHLSDNPNGLGKLGKMVQICYPNINQDHSEYDIVPERTRVGQYIKRVIGLSNKDKKKGKGTNNEDTYQLVTPFIPNEWG